MPWKHEVWPGFHIRPRILNPSIWARLAFMRDNDFARLKQRLLAEEAVRHGNFLWLRLQVRNQVSDSHDISFFGAHFLSFYNSYRRPASTTL